MSLVVKALRVAVDSDGITMPPKPTGKAMSGERHRVNVVGGVGAPTGRRQTPRRLVPDGRRPVEGGSRQQRDDIGRGTRRDRRILRRHSPGAPRGQLPPCRMMRGRSLMP
jgi:hypothetical protein